MRRVSYIRRLKQALYRLQAVWAGVSYPKQYIREALPAAGFIAQNKEENILQQSTSGGVLPCLRKMSCKKAGAVFGAVMDESFRVIHVWTKKRRVSLPCAVQSMCRAK